MDEPTGRTTPNPGIEMGPAQDDNLYPLLVLMGIIVVAVLLAFDWYARLQ